MSNKRLVGAFVCFFVSSLIVGCETNSSINDLGYARFHFKVHDGQTYSEDSYVMTIEVNPVQDAPVASDNTVTAYEDTPYVFTEDEFNFEDVDGDNLKKIQITSLGTTGNLKLNNQDVALDDVVMVEDINAGNFIFEPQANAHGDGYGMFQFKVHDGIEYSESDYSMAIDVTAVNDAPTSTDYAIAISDGESYEFKPDDFAFSDNDGDEVTKVQIISLANTGGLRLDGEIVNAEDEISIADLRAGTLTFDSNLRTGVAEHEGFQFRVHDGLLYSDSSYTMAIEVSKINTLPTTADNTIVINEDTDYVFKLSDFPFHDDDNDVMAHVQITLAELSGSLKINGEEVSTNHIVLVDEIVSGQMIFEPNLNEFSTGHNRFQFKVHDGTAYSESQHTMAIDIAAVNDAPTASDRTVSTNEDVAYIFTPSDFTLQDVDGDTITQIQVTSLELIGSLKLNGSDVAINDVISIEDIRMGNLTFQPQADWNNSANVTFSVSDNKERNRASVRLNIESDSVTSKKVAIQQNHDE